MKTSTIEVRDMLSVLSVIGVEKRIGGVPGVESVTVNYAAGNATVRYDETRLNIADIKSGVRQSGNESAASGAATVGDGHVDHTATGAPLPNAAPAGPKSAPEAAATTTASAAPPGQSDKAASGVTASPKGAPAASKPSPATAPASAAGQTDKEAMHKS